MGHNEVRRLPATSGQAGELADLKELTHSNISYEGNPARLLKAADNVESWAAGGTSIPGLLSTLIVKGAVGDKLKAIGVLRRAADSGLSTYTLAHTLGDAMMFDCGPETRKGLADIVLAHNRKYGLGDEDVLKHWLMADDADKRGPLLYRNFSALEDLHKERPQAAKALHDAYGISCFGRYSTGTLVRQFDSMNESRDLAAVALFCRSDRGGMFYGMPGIVEGLSRDLNMKVVEGEDTDELSATFRSFRTRHGKRAKYGLIVMHKDTLDALLAKTMRTYDETWGLAFEDRPSIVIVSSRVTTPGGAKDLLEAKGAKVVGPSHVIYRCPQAISYEVRDGGINFKVDFDRD